MTSAKTALLRWPGGRTTMVKRLRGSIQSPQGLTMARPAQPVARTARLRGPARSGGVWVALASART